MIRRDDVSLDNGEILDHDTQEVMVREQPGSLSYQIPREFRILDPTAPQGLAVEEIRPEWIATISAGFKQTNDRGITYPAVSRDGTIHIPNDKDRENAPELVEALKATGGKKLTIAFCSDDINEIILQRFVRYSASTLEVFGDEHSLTYVTAAAREGDKPASLQFHKVYVGSNEYAALVKTCKAETSVLFALAEWTPEGEPRMIWSGNYGRYRIRFTSRNSVRSILRKLVEVLPLTKGRIAGIPWELTIGYRDVAGPDAAKGVLARRNIPVWQIAFKVPGGLKVDPFRLDRVVQRAALNAAPLLALPAPKYTVEHALLEAPSEPDDLDEIDLTEALASTDPPCDIKYFRDHWHAMVANDPLLSTEEGRHKFVRKFTETRWPDSPHRHTASLETFLNGDPQRGTPQASESEANALLAQGAEALTALQRQRMAKRMGNDGRATSTAPAQPAPRPRPQPPTQPASEPTPIAAPAPEEVEEPIAAQLEPAPSPTPEIGPEAPLEEEETPDIGQYEEAPMDGDFREEGNTPATEPLATNESEAKLATEKQRKDIEQWVSPGRRAQLDYATLTTEDAALLLDEYKPAKR